MLHRGVEHGEVRHATPGALGRARRQLVLRDHVPQPVRGGKGAHAVVAGVGAIEERALEARSGQHVGGAAHGEGVDVADQRQVPRQRAQATRHRRQPLRGAHAGLPGAGAGQDAGARATGCLVQAADDGGQGAGRCGLERVQVGAAEALERELKHRHRPVPRSEERAGHAAQRLHQRRRGGRSLTVELAGVGVRSALRARGGPAQAGGAGFDVGGREVQLTQQRGGLGRRAARDEVDGRLHQRVEGCAQGAGREPVRHARLHLHHAPGRHRAGRQAHQQAHGPRARLHRARSTPPPPPRHHHGSGGQRTQRHGHPHALVADEAHHAFHEGRVAAVGQHLGQRGEGAALGLHFLLNERHHAQQQSQRRYHQQRHRQRATRTGSTSTSTDDPHSDGHHQHQRAHHRSHRREVDHRAGHRAGNTLEAGAAAHPHRHAQPRRQQREPQQPHRDEGRDDAVTEGRAIHGARRDAAWGKRVATTKHEEVGARKAGGTRDGAHVSGVTTQQGLSGARPSTSSG